MTSWTPSPWDVLELVGNHLWQSTLCLAAAALLTLALKRNRAQARYWIWLAASLKFLVPFAPLIALGRQASWRSPARVVQPAMTALLDGMSQPFSRSAVDVGAASPALASSHLELTLPPLILVVWLAGCVVTLLVWWAGWRRLTRAVREASPFQGGRELDILRRLEMLAGVKTPTRLVWSNTSLEPGVFGLMQPVLLWPQSIGDRLTNRQIEALIAHEVCHLRRSDNLAAAAHMIVEALFWFHPLVWWLERRLVDERERACDEAVIAWGHEPIEYAESILKTCEFYAQSRLTCVAGITGADLKKRIEAIMRNQHGASLGVPKKRILATVGVAALAAPIIVGALGAPRLAAQAPAPSGPTTPRFEVASVKRNVDPDGPRLFQALPGGQVNLINQTVHMLIYSAYQTQDYKVIGGPDWLGSDRFDIVAKADSSTPLPQRLLMVRTLLADRFKLAMHTETRQLPIYTLVMARADRRPGPQLKAAARDCSPLAPGAAARPPLPDGRPACGNQVRAGSIVAGGVTIDSLTNRLGALAQIGRPVVNQTGLTGLFDFDLTFSPDQPDAAPSPDAVSIFTALQEQLGLKLESTRGPVDVFVIDHVKQPTDNQADAASPAFETASIKPNRSGEPGGRSAYKPGRYVGTNVTLRRAIGLAYAPLLGFQIVGGPGWINVDRFDIQGKAEGNPSRPQLALMLRALLAERFKLATHIERRELPAYALVSARNDGAYPQLRQSDVDCSAARGNGPPVPAQPDPERGRAPSCGFSVGDTAMSGRGITLGMLARELAGIVGDRVVVDRTGLTGGFDVNLEWTPETGNAPPPGSPPSIFTALREQLGLKLDSTRSPVDVLVIDRAERPTPD